MLLDMQLYVPRQDAKARSAGVFTARQTKKWIEELPLINLDQAAVQLVELLSSSNAADAASKQRIAMIELLEPVAVNLLDHFRKYLSCQSFPLSKKSEQAFDTQQTLYTELSVSHKIIVQDALQQKWKLDKKRLLTCMHHAFALLSKQYGACIQVYKKPHENIWQDLCGLYSAAEKIGLSTTKLKATIGYGAAVSIEDMFKQSCSLSLITTNKLRAGEAEKISRFLQTNSDQIELLQRVSKRNEEHVYCVNLSTQRKPIHYSVGRSQISTEMRFINYTGLISALQQQSNSSSESASRDVLDDSILDADLAKRVKDMLKSPAQRSLNRESKQSSVKVAVSIEKIHEALTPRREETHEDLSNNNFFAFDNLGLMPLSEDVDPSDSIFASNASASEDDKLWDPFVSERQSKVADTIIEKSKPTDTGMFFAQPDLYDWTIIDLSDDGCCLRRDSGVTCSTRVGDLIAIYSEEESNTDPQWKIGVVRWMQGLVNGGHKLGLQLFRAEVMRADIRLPDDNTLEFPGLLLNHSCDSREPRYSILLPTHRQLASDQLQISFGSNIKTLQLGRALEKTSAFTHLAVRALDPVQTH